MVLPATPASDFADALAAEIRHNYALGRVIVAVDGVEGTAPFADELARAFTRAGAHAVRASLDDFQRPRAARELRGADSPEGYYFDRHDLSTLRRVLIEPFRMAGSAGFQTASFDAARDVERESKWLTAPADAVLVLDGPFLQRPGLRGTFSYTVYLEGRRFGLDPAVTGADELYQAEAGPRFGASAIIDIADPEHPHRSFADSC
jgi:uridine kinase